MSGQLSQLPDRAKNGSFLPQSSVVGRAVDFIVPAGTTAFTTMTISAQTYQTLSISASLYDPNLPTAAKNTANVLNKLQAQIFYYIDVFIDNLDNFNYEMAIGASLSADQKLVYMLSQWDEMSPPVGTTQRRIYQFFNNSAATPHTVYVRAYIKYIITS